MDFVHDLITSRGSQLLSRYVGMGLVALLTKLHYAPAEGEVLSTSNLIAGLVVSGILIVIDHYAHGVQKADDAK